MQPGMAVLIQLLSTIPGSTETFRIRHDAQGYIIQWRQVRIHIDPSHPHMVDIQGVYRAEPIWLQCEVRDVWKQVTELCAENSLHDRLVRSAL